MTARRDRKKLVRERQARTGERYTTALRHVLEGRMSPVPVVEMIDLGEEAARCGLRCRVLAYAGLLDRIDREGLLERVRAALVASEDDPAAAPLCGAALRGEAAALPIPGLINLAAARRFVERARLGLGGFSPGGHLMALHLPGRGETVTVLAALWTTPAGPWAPRDPALVLTTPDWLRLDLVEALAVPR